MNFPIRAFTFLLVPAVLLPAETAEWPPQAKRYRMHMIGNGHIDPVWLWPWQEGLSVVHSTFRSALDRMKEMPDFAFTASSAQFYAWVAENDPAMLAEIRKRVREGRWGLVGGWWVEPDINIPGGEALIRQGLYGQLTFKRLFGRTAQVGFNPDGFGHVGTLPQILKLQGLTSYTFQRPEPHEKTLPADLFWWESPDGTRTLTYRIPFSYNDSRSVRKRLERIIAEVKTPLPVLMAFYGVGDHGGGATKENIRSIEEIQAELGAPTLVYSTPEKYFAAIREAGTSGLPVVRDDLQHHAVGCYTAESAVKKGNRSAEIALISAEKLASVGSAVWGASYPRVKFTSAWEKVLLLQFHDSLAGTSLPEHYQSTALQGYGFAHAVAQDATYKAAQKLAWQIPAKDPESEYLVAFNLHSWPVVANIEYDLAWKAETPSQVEDGKGNIIPHQWIPAMTEVRDRRRLIVQTSVPAFGYRQIRVRKTAAPPLESRVRADQRTLENEHLVVTIANDGSIGIYDKDAKKEVFTGGTTGARALIIDDPSGTWSHNVRAFTEQVGAFGSANATVLENGPVRAGIRVRSTYGASTLTTDWLLYAGSRAVEARVTLDWHEKLKMLKFSFPVDVASPKPTYEVAYGHIVRDIYGDEEPGQRWIDLTGGEYGFAVINDAKYGYSVQGNDMRISVVPGAAYAHHIPHVLGQDQGVQIMRMLLVPHQGQWQDAGLQRIAEEFTTPVPVVYQGIHPGTRPESDSMLAVDAKNVVVSAVKKAETGDDLILRCYETDGKPVSALIDLRFMKKQWSGQFRPLEIKTLRMNAQTGQIREVNALEE